MQFEETRGRLGFHFMDGKGEPRPAPAYVQIYVKSSALSRVADLAISKHLTTSAELDTFIDDAIAALQELRVDAKNALASAKRD